MTDITEKESDLIIECQVRRFTTVEALAYLAKNDITMSERTYRRHKNEIEGKMEERLFIESGIGRVQQMVLGIDTLKKVEKELWNTYYSTQNDVLKERILKSIDNLQARFTGYYKDVAFRALGWKERRKDEEKRIREAQEIAKQETEPIKQEALTN